MQSNTKTVSIKLEETLYNQLKEEAYQSKRSLGKMCEFILEEGLGHRHTDSLQKLNEKLDEVI